MTAAPPPEEDEAKKKDDSNGNVAAVAAGAVSRENFLRRLEQQRQQQNNNETKKSVETVEKELTKALKEAERELKKIDDDDVVNIGDVVVDDNTNDNGEMKKGSEKDTSDMKNGTNDNVNMKDGAAPPSSSTTTTTTRQSLQEKKDPQQSVGDRLLIDYLSKYSEPAAGGKTSDISNWLKDVEPSSLLFLKGLAGINEPTTTPPSNTNDNGNATIRRASSSSSTTDALLHDAFNVIGQLQHKKDEPTQLMEVIVPSHAKPGEPFLLHANGVRVKVNCPTDAKPGNRIRFNLPTRLFDTPAPPPLPEEEPLPPPPPHISHNLSMEQIISRHYNSDIPIINENEQLVTVTIDGVVTEIKLGEEFGELTQHHMDKERHGTKKEEEDEAKPKSSSAAIEGATPSTSESPRENESSLQQRMLNIIEQQQAQLYDMQSRIDALGGMMAQMQQDVGYLCHNTDQQQQQQRQQVGMGLIPPHNMPPPQHQRGIMGGFFGGARNDAVGGLPLHQQQGTPPPPQPPAAMQPHRGQRDAAGDAGLQAHLGLLDWDAAQQRQHQQQQQQQPPLPQPEQVPNAYAPGQAPNNVPRALPVANPLHQGIFFPLFVRLFQFIISLPNRVRSIFINTRVGRVYAHIRQQAIERRAFRNVDFGSIVKLIVMLLIFTGRVGGGGNEGTGGGQRGRNRRNNARGNNNNNDQEDADENSFAAYVATVMQYMLDYWNGHRVHTLIYASLIAFLVQVGLATFFYDVIWVERDALVRAWLGQQQQQQEEGGENNEAEGENEIGQQGAVDNNDNAAANANADRRPGWHLRLNQPPANANADERARGGWIGRGPENGGFLHDIQCLILSFLLSLIPAWRPEEAAGPEPEVVEEPEVIEQPEQEQGGNQADVPQEPDQPGHNDGGDGDNGGADNALPPVVEVN